MNSSTSTTVILGVDTHLDAHVGVVIDAVGRVLGTRTIPTTVAGYGQLLDWAQTYGQLTQVGVEGTNTYGSGLSQFLSAAGLPVIEVNRPDRSRRRLRGKSDPTDAENAARAVLAGDAKAVAKRQGGLVEAMRAISVARRSAVKARTQTGNQLRSLLVSAPEGLRDELRALRLPAIAERCAGFRPSTEATATAVLKRALRLLAKRWLSLTEELKTLDDELKRLTQLLAPSLLTRFGIGPQTAATLLLTAGDNPDRLRSEAAFAALCGASPVEASSGKVVRHRLNRGGDRQANNALWTIALVRMRSDSRTREYVERRTQEGRSDKEICRCLKRYIAREVYPLIVAGLGVIEPLAD